MENKKKLLQIESTEYDKMDIHANKIASDITKHK